MSPYKSQKTPATATIIKYCKSCYLKRFKTNYHAAHLSVYISLVKKQLQTTLLVDNKDNIWLFYLVIVSIFQKYLFLSHCVFGENTVSYMKNR